MVFPSTRASHIETEDSVRAHSPENRGQRGNLEKIRGKAVSASATPTNADIESLLQKLGEPLLVSFECFDVFSDPTGQKLAAHQKVLEALTTKLGVKFR